MAMILYKTDWRGSHYLSALSVWQSQWFYIIIAAKHASFLLSGIQWYRSLVEKLFSKHQKAICSLAENSIWGE